MMVCWLCFLLAGRVALLVPCGRTNPTVLHVSLQAKAGRSFLTLQSQSHTFPSFAMLPVSLRNGVGSLAGPPVAKAHRTRLAPRAAAGQPQTAAPVHSNGAAKPDAAREALSNGTPAPSQAPAAEPAGSAQPAAAGRYLINRIPRSRWENGIPAVMGAHLMGSGEVSPISTSKGAACGDAPGCAVRSNPLRERSGGLCLRVLIVQHSVAGSCAACCVLSFALWRTFLRTVYYKSGFASGYSALH